MKLTDMPGEFGKNPRRRLSASSRHTTRFVQAAGHGRRTAMASHARLTTLHICAPARANHGGILTTRTPSIDHLFDRRFVSFEDNDRLIGFAYCACSFQEQTGHT